MKSIKKVLASVLALAMVVTAVPATTAEAATTGVPKTKTYYAGKSYTLKLTTPKSWKSVKTTWSEKNSAISLSSKKTKSVKVKAIKATKKATVKVKVTYKKSSKKGAKRYTKNYSTVITIKNPSVSAPKTAEVETGATVSVKATATPSSAKVTYKSSDDAVATVDAQGIVTGVKAGTATITATATCGTVKKTAKTVVTVKEAEKPQDLSLTATATKADTITATLSRELVTTGAAVTVTKKGLTTAVDGTVEISGTTVTFKGTANLTKGTYTVTVKDGDVTASADVEVQDEYVKEIVINSKTALLGITPDGDTDNKTAYIYYDVLNQYGESVRMSTSIEWSSSAKSIKADKSTGKLTVESDATNGFVYGNQIYVTGVYTKTGVNVNQAVPVGMVQALNSAKAVGFVDKNKPNTKLDSLPVDFAKNTYYMIYETKDQEDHPMDATDNNIASSKVTMLSSDILKLKIADGDGKDGTKREKTFTVGGVEYSGILVQPGQYVDKGGEVTITAISNKTGNKTESTFSIAPNALLQSLTITGPEKTVADGDEDVKLNYVAKDTAGNAVTDYETIVRSTNALSLTTSVGETYVKEEKDGSAGIYWTDDAKYRAATYENDSQDGIDRNVAITTVIIGGDSSNYMLSVSDRRRPAVIKDVLSLNKDAKAIVAGDSKTIDFEDKDQVKYLDQYGDPMDADKAAVFFKYSNSEGYTNNGTRYTYGILATTTSDANALSINKKNLVEISDTTPGALTVTATTGSTIESTTVKFSIASIKNGEYTPNAEKWDVDGKITNISFDTVPVKKLSGIAFDSLGKQKVDTDYQNYSNLAEAGNVDVTAKATSDGALTVNSDAGIKLTVIGKYNGKDLEIPNKYYAVTTGENFAVSGAAFGADGNILNKVDTTSTLKLSDLYDTNSARLTRKDAKLSVSATVYNELVSASAADTTTTNGAIKLDITLSDEAYKIASVAIKDGTSNVISAVSGSFIVAEKFDLDGTDGDGENDNVIVKDQYGNKVTDAELVFTVSDPTESTDAKLTRVADSLQVNQNGSHKAELSIAEIGDKFKITITAKKNGVEVTSAPFEITLGGDDWARITSTGSTKDQKDYAFRTTYLGYDR